MTASSSPHGKLSAIHCLQFLHRTLRARPLLLTSRCYSVLKDRFVTPLLQTLNGQAPREPALLLNLLNLVNYFLHIV